MMLLTRVLVVARQCQKKSNIADEDQPSDTIDTDSELQEGRDFRLTSPHITCSSYSNGPFDMMLPTYATPLNNKSSRVFVSKVPRKTWRGARLILTGMNHWITLAFHLFARTMLRVYQVAYHT
jgi:hypothetical protein